MSMDEDEADRLHCDRNGFCLIKKTHVFQLQQFEP